MIKRTLYFGSAAYLKTRNEQLIIDNQDTAETKQCAVEDIGVVILDHPQITITQALMAKLLANNVALITCNETHHPTGLLLNLDGHTLQSQKFQAQVEATQPLKKQLWQQTIAAKITNQAAWLQQLKLPVKNMQFWAREVKSGDADNHEAMAAVYYWKHAFTHTAFAPSTETPFQRDRMGAPPNHLLNYGYAILRAIVARSLVASGLLPTLGIFHKNQYNAYCLADDMMEPYRPFVDRLVWKIVRDKGIYLEMSTDIKKQLLTIPTLDVLMKNQKSPLMVAVQKTTASLAACFEGKLRRIAFPEWVE